MGNRSWIVGAGIAALAVIAALFLFSANNEDATAQDEDIVTLHRGNGAEPATLDPNKETGIWETTITGDLLMGLYTPGADAKPILGSAEAHDVSEDGMTHTFTIREGLRWSDGVPVTAYDFQYAWRRFVNPETAAEFASLMDWVVNADEIIRGELPPEELGAVAVDDRTFVVHLTHPEPFIPEITATYYTYPIPAHVVEEHGDAWTRAGTYVSNGPFVLTEWVSNDHITLEKNPEFYDAENVALDRIVYLPTDDSASALRRFRAGELDVNSDFPSQQYEWLQENMADSIRVAPMLTVSYITINTVVPPFDDARIRRALGLAINRVQVTDQVLRTGQIPTFTLVPPYVDNYLSPTPDYASWTQEERVAEARRLLAEAGYGEDNPLTFTYRYRESIDNRRVAVAVANMWNAVGVEVNLVNTEPAIHYADMRAGNYQVADGGWIVSYPDPGQFLLLANRDYGELNNSNYSNQDYADLYALAQSTVDRDERGRIFAEAEALMLYEAPMLPSHFGVSRSLVGPHVQGWVDSPENVHRSRWISIDESLRPEQTSFADRIMRLFN